MSRSFIPTVVSCSPLRLSRSVVSLALSLALPWCARADAAREQPEAAPLSPAAMAVSKDGRTLFVACATGGRVLWVDAASMEVMREVNVGESPLGLAVAPDGATLAVTCASPQSEVLLLRTEDGSVAGRIPGGHTAVSPIFSKDGSRLYVCYRFENTVGVIDLAEHKLAAKIPVRREPIASALTPDGTRLLVAHHLHAGRSDTSYVGASVSVIHLGQQRVVQQIRLPNGSGLLRDIQLSPDGKYFCVTHLVSRFQLPTTQIERGWINSNAITLIDAETLERINTVLLDNIDRGAANPWAAAWSEDSSKLLVTHAGLHEVSVIHLPGLIAKLRAVPAQQASVQPAGYSSAVRSAADVPNDLAFLVGLRERVQLPAPNNGPRSALVLGSLAYVANYFSGTIARFDLARPSVSMATFPLGSSPEMTEVRRGEMLFNDATICFQGWQSCASCHSSDARVDALNWDLLNDGIGNPKNVKSLLLAHQTPPSMSLGVRASAEVAVRAGIRHSFFTVRPDDEPAAIDAYLKALTPIPSPHLVEGRLSERAERGKILFLDERVGCASCHKGELYTDQSLRDVGTAGRYDVKGALFDTPTLIELWRTAPYLHDGRAVTLQEVLTMWNPGNQHGITSHLTPEQISDLAEFLLSL